MIDTVILVSGWRGQKVISNVEYRLSRYHFTEGAQVMMIHGGCKTGVDKIAHQYARRMGWAISIFPANFERERGGPERNTEMIHCAKLYNEYGADIFAETFPHEEESIGTWDLINKAKKEEFKLFINSKEHEYNQGTLFA